MDRTALEENIAGEKGTRQLYDSRSNTIANAVEYNGHTYSLYWNGYVERIDRFNAEFKPRPTDIFLLSYPKSGTHWLWEVIMMLTRSSAKPRTENKESAMVEMVDLVDLEAFEDPRVINAHLACSDVPASIMESGSHKLIQMHRNPKDVAVSAYIHYAAEKSGTNLTCNWDYFIRELYHSPKDMLNLTWCDYTTQWWEKSRSMENFLSIFYEDMKQDPRTLVRQLANFLNLKVTEDLIGQIVENTSFASMKKHKAARESREWEIYFEPGFTMYRKGVVGDWKNHFTVTQNELFDTHFHRQIKSVPELASRLIYTMPVQ